MPQLNWDAFAQLPGSAQQNFEDLCRAAIRLQFGRFGEFRRVANQPGVEFHLQLREGCLIGPAGEWHGWQCRWYDLPPGRALGAGRRKKILEAIRTTERELPGLTHWTLWTRHLLTKGDQAWFYAISTKLKRQLLSAADIDPYLGGAAEMLRSSYFGELVLTRGDLATRHKESVAPILPRWLPSVHQQLEVERQIRRMLGESGSWAELLEIAGRLEAIDRLLARETGMSERLRRVTADFQTAAKRSAAALRQTHAALTAGDFDLLRDVLKNGPDYPTWGVRSAAGAFRAVGRLVALQVTNAVEDLILAHRLGREIDELVGVRMLAVRADAGSGKTQLAAELTKELPDRSAGILLHGRTLHARQNLDDLARKVTLHGRPLTGIEALVAALDAAGQRERRRLPMVIDGLNEAENPGDWKDPLASLDAMLECYPNVLTVVTLRTGSRKPEGLHSWSPFEAHPKESTPRAFFSDLAVPEHVRKLDMTGFGALSTAAVQAYFKFYRIVGEAELPYELLSHPLSLRMFCEVANPKRERNVDYETTPRSLTGLFERFLDECAKRIAQLADPAHSYCAEDVRKVYYAIGERLWVRRVRGLDERELRIALDDEKRSWKNSIVHMLEYEGVVLRNEGDKPGDHVVVPVYDALGGYLVADYLVRCLGMAGFSEWIAKPQTLGLLDEASRNAHGFASDIFRALVGLVPREYSGCQLWPLLTGSLQADALRLAIQEGARLDSKTIGAIAELVRNQSAPAIIFDDLTRVAGAKGHPLNALFLDAELRKMPVADRDLRWTEWIRRQVEPGLYDWENHFENIGYSWKENSVRTATDHLRARWTMWGLTTTSRALRYAVTRALYWYGLAAPGALFDLCLESLGINDPYVPERMLAASYGVAMSLYAQPARAGEAKPAVSRFARGLYSVMFAPPAPAVSTTHSLVREYVRCILQLAIVWDKRLFSGPEKAALGARPLTVGSEWPEVTPEKAATYGLDSPLRTDFREHSIGRLIDGRASHDLDHPEHKKVTGQLLWRVEQLGWFADRFRITDQQIANSVDRHYDHEFKTDRYGKKYSVIAYRELEGRRHEAGLLKLRADGGRPVDMDIDPSFPQPCAEAHLVTEDLLGTGVGNAVEWARNGPVTDLQDYFRQASIAGEKGPWIMLDGVLTQEDVARGRRLHCNVNTFIVARQDVASFTAELQKRRNRALELADRPAAVMAFAGEIPWCDTYPAYGRTPIELEVARTPVVRSRVEQQFYRDGKRLEISYLAGLQERMQRFPSRDYPPELAAEIESIKVRKVRISEEHIEPKYRTFRAELPVCDFAPERPSLEGEVAGPMLAKELAKALNLIWVPGTLDLATRDGQRTTIGIAHRTQSLNNRQRFFYFRENALVKYLTARKAALVFVTFGERMLTAHEAAKTSEYEDRIVAFQAIKVLRRR